MVPKQISAKWQQFSLEVGVGEVARRLAGGAHGVVGQVGYGTTVLDRARDLSDLRDVASPRATLPCFVDQFDVDEEVDVVGDLPVGLLNCQDTALRDAGRQAVHGGLCRVRVG